MSHKVTEILEVVVKLLERINNTFDHVKSTLLVLDKRLRDLEKGA